MVIREASQLQLSFSKSSREPRQLCDMAFFFSAMHAGQTGPGRSAEGPPEVMGRSQCCWGLLDGICCFSQEPLGLGLAEVALFLTLPASESLQGSLAVHVLGLLNKSAYS